MRFLPLQALVPSLCLILPTPPALAHVGSRVYPIYELSTSQLPDLHDGTLEDWEAVVPSASMDHTDFVLDLGTAAAVEPEDLGWRIFLAWHYGTQTLYVAIQRFDDAYVALDGTLESLGEQVTFYVDGDHSGGQYTGWSSQGLTENERRQLEMAQAQLYGIGPRAGENRLVRSIWEWLGPPWVDAGGYYDEREPNLALFELSVTPWDRMSPTGPDGVRSRLTPEAVIGFDFLLLDTDQLGGVLSGQYATSLPIDTRTADHFVDGILIPCQVEDCSRAGVSDVAADTWGRIKAGLR